MNYVLLMSKIFNILITLSICKQIIFLKTFCFRLLCDIKVLVPGAGLGRLAYELAYRGYSCQGNEFSVFMLFASNFVLNRYDIHKTRSLK